MSEEKYILVSGTSSGLGKELVKVLSSKGFRVFAGVRKETDLSDWHRYENVLPVLLDITKADVINAAFVQVRKTVGTEGLFALINNAGINYLTAFEPADEHRERQVLEVNLLGAMRLTRRMLPLLHHYPRHPGDSAKIINISSIGAIFGLPWEAAYHASKFGMLGWSESLRYELEGLNISVACFLPGGMKTRIFEKSASSFSMDDPYSSGMQHEYYRRNLEHMRKVMKNFEKSSSSPFEAANKIAKVLNKRKIPLKIFFGKDAFFISTLSKLGLIHLLRGRFTVR